MRRTIAVLAVLAGMAASSPARGEAQFPESLKGVVPEYPGATVEHGMETGAASQVHQTVVDDPKAVLDFYRKAMVEKGWSVEAETSLAQGGIILFKEGKRSLNVVAIVPEGEQKTRVVISLAGEQAPAGR